MLPELRTAGGGGGGAAMCGGPPLSPCLHPSIFEPIIRKSILTHCSTSRTHHRGKEMQQDGEASTGGGRRVSRSSQKQKQRHMQKWCKQAGCSAHACADRWAARHAGLCCGQAAAMQASEQKKAALQRLHLNRRPPSARSCSRNLPQAWQTRCCLLLPAACWSAAAGGGCAAADGCSPAGCAGAAAARCARPTTLPSPRRQRRPRHALQGTPAGAARSSCSGLLLTASWRRRRQRQGLREQPHSPSRRTARRAAGAAPN